MTLSFRTGLAALLCSFVLFFAPAAQARDRDMTEDILYFTNKFRSSKGLKPLVLLDELSEQAQAHSKNMARKKVGFGHKGFDKRTAAIRSELGWGSAFAENVAYGHLDAEAVVNLWINSPGHRKNLLGDYTHIGIGIAEARDGSLYFTQIFLAK
ncbi:CAP domain-containing protein [Taibaiella chishuiensis]|uniref:Uncharacterized protein YkwD n=1 Tax=Taibaiella chishuiensis TaxID=1434707 RepID=A0A2P8D749_9BACT|nr:CAP domain-containing protein [Taibaiella chishuiensis]PSK93044.1 uncharacterized protein YkwD [Taibaiella chishuiensis]